MKKVRLNDRGAVLFTVICLMSILTVVLMTTIAVVASSNRKSVTNYTDDQAYVTNKSIVDIFTEGLTDKNNTDFDEMRKKIFGMATNELKISVDLPSEIKANLPTDASGKPYITVTKNLSSEFTITSSDEKSNTSVSKLLKLVVTHVSSPGDGTFVNLNYLDGNGEISKSASVGFPHEIRLLAMPTVAAVPGRAIKNDGTWHPVDNGEPGYDATSTDNSWTVGFDRGSSNFFSDFPGAKFIWENYNGTISYRKTNQYYNNIGASSNKYKGDTVRFEFKVQYNGIVNSDTSFMIRCAADDAWVGYLNGEYFGSGNVSLTDVSNLSSIILNTADIEGSDRQVYNNFFIDTSQEWYKSGKRINIDYTKIRSGENTIVIYAKNNPGGFYLAQTPLDTLSYSQQSNQNPCCLVFGCVVNGAAVNPASGSYDGFEFQDAGYVR